MRVDLLLDPFDARWDQVREAALMAESSGFDGLWTWDHLGGMVHGARHVLECWTTLTAVAATVPRLSIGPLVLNVFNRDPGTLAVMAATLQQISEGRLILGLGAGGSPESPYAAEQRALGRPVSGDRPRRRAVAETIEVLRRVWRGPPDGDGGFLRPEPPPPLVVGAFGPKMAELAGRVADGINLPAVSPGLDDLIAVARRAFAQSGRDPARFLVTVFSGLDARWLRPDSPQRDRLAALSVDRLVLLVGPPYIDSIRRYRRSVP